jgi:hypothetical protein
VTVTEEGMEPPGLLEWRVTKLLTLCRQLGATEEQIEDAYRMPPTPEPLANHVGAFPAIDPAPYIAGMSDVERWHMNLPEPGTPMCDARITAEASDLIRQNGDPSVTGITTCILPRGHANANTWGQEVAHVGLILGLEFMGKPSLAAWQWLAPARGLGEVRTR